MARTKFDIKAEAQRTLHATVGAVDLAAETVMDVVTDAQKRLDGYQKGAQKRISKAQSSVRGIDLQPKALRQQATARRDAVEKRVADLQSDAQKFVNGNVETATDTYDDLVKRGETVVRRFRSQPAAKETVRNAKTTVSKAKTTVTQAENTTAKVRSAAKKTAADVKKTAAQVEKTTDEVKQTAVAAKKTVKKSPAVSSAKATRTSAKKTVSSAAKAIS